jgi:hypothetical protein
MGIVARDDVATTSLAVVFQSDHRLGKPERVQTIRRGFFDPLPIE